MKEANAIPWQTEIVRVTAFPIAGATILPNSWKEITGNEPDETVKQRAPMQSFEAGPFFGGRLSVGHQPGRIDLVLMPDQTVPFDGLAHVGSLDPAIDHVLPAAQKMFRPDIVMHRLAVGAVLVNPVESPPDGYKVLRSILPIAREIPEGARDFSFQLNVPIGVNVTGIPDMQINRLVKWNVARFHIMNMVSGSGAPGQVVGGAEISAVRVELDINTPAELAIAVSYQNILELIDHMAAQARAIAANRGWFPE